MDRKALDKLAYETYLDSGDNYTAAARQLGIAPMTCRSRVLRHIKNQAAAKVNSLGARRGNLPRGAEADKVRAAATAAAVAAKAKPKVDLTVPRCGTCYQPCDPWNSDEGYSHCCNDRIEYPEEYAQDPYFRHEMLGEPCPHEETWEEEDPEVKGRFVTTCTYCGQDLGVTER